MLSRSNLRCTLMSLHCSVLCLFLRNFCSLIVLDAFINREGHW
jgi:hypothetical protein